MTSKISFFKLMEYNIRHRGWLAALNTVVLFLLLPVYSLMTIDSIKAQSVYADSPMTDYKYIAEQFPGMLNGSSNRTLALFILIAAIFCGVTGFAFLHSREKQDFYLGMPVSRLQWFALSYTGGLLIFIVPYLLFGIGTLLIVQFSGLITAAIFIRCLIALLGGVLGFLICYHTVILAMTLTGRMVTGVLAALVLLSYGSIVSSLSSGLADTFYAAWVQPKSGFSQKIWDYLSPALLFTKTVTRTSYGAFREFSYVPILCTVLLSALFLWLAIQIYRRYPAEAADNALAFPKSAPLIKILIVIPSALFIGQFIQSLRYRDGVRWLIITGILSAILLCLLIEFIYHRDLSKICKGKISSAISIGLVGIIFCILQFDILGYDRYLPDKTKLEGISFHTESFRSYFSYPEDYALSFSGLIEPVTVALTDYDSIYKLAEEGIENLENGVTPLTVTQSEFPDYLTVTLNYQMKNGKTTSRRYAVEQTQALETLAYLCENEQYRKDLFPIFHVNRGDVQKILVQDIYQQTKPLALTMEQQNSLLNAYEKDILSVDIKTLQYDSPIGEMYLTLPYSSAADSDIIDPAAAELPSEIDVSQFYIYSSYTNTLRALEEYGYIPRTEIEADDVLSMFYYPNIGSGDDNYATTTDIDYKSGNGIQITDPQEIKNMLTRIRSSSSPGILSDNQNTITGSVEITLTGSSHPITYLVTQ